MIKMTLQKNIFLFNTAIIFVSMCSLLILVTDIFSDYILDTQKDSVEKQIQLISNNLDMLIETTQDHLVVLATDKMLTDELTDYRKVKIKSDLFNLGTQINVGKMTSNMISPNTHIPCAIIATGGKILYAGYMLDDEQMYEYDQFVLDENQCVDQKPVWGYLQSISYEDMTSESVFPVFKAIVDKDSGETLGVVTFFLREKSVEEVYQKANQGNIFYVLDNNGMVVSAVDKELLGTQMAIEEKEGYLLNCQTYEKMDWQIVCYTDMRSFYEQKQKIINSNIVILIVLIITAFISAYVISWAITKPVYSLVETMKKITADKINLHIRAEEMENSEIGFLGKEFNQLMDRVEESEQQMYEHQRARRNSELLLLQSQIKPHFLYNTMETISSFIKLDYKDLALETVQNISMFYRKSLSGGNDIITIKKELEIIGYYLKIQSLRYHTCLEYSMEIAPEIEPYFIPKLTLQPMIENAIYHGIKPKNGKGEIVIRGYQQGQQIILEVFDTGVGMKHSTLLLLQEKIKCGANTSSDSGGFGLYNVNERMRLFFGDEYSMAVESEENEYTQITLVVPVEQFVEEMSGKSS